MKLIRSMLFGAFAFAALATALFANAAPAQARTELFGLPGWTGPHILTFELVNFGVTQTALLVCQRRVTDTPAEFAFAWVPILGPYEAIKTCFRPPERAARRARR